MFTAACHSTPGYVCFVNLFRSILPVVPTECVVLIVCRQHYDKEWKFKEQHAQMWENIAGAKRYSRPVVSTSLFIRAVYIYALYCTAVVSYVVFSNSSVAC